MKPHQRILEQIYDVLAHNTQYIDPQYIADNFGTYVDFDNDAIELWDDDGDEAKLICTLKIEYAEREA